MFGPPTGSSSSSSSSSLTLGLLVTCCLVAFEWARLGLSGVVEDKYSCPHGWTRYGSKKCLKYVSELQDYERAQATCRSKNQGSLVTVHSHEEQNFVYSYIHSIAASSTPIWLGAKQIDFESILWLDKTENSYANWAPSEPSHPDEICIAINPRNGLWHDVMCTEANVPACERAPTTQWPFFVAFCSEGWFQYNDEKCVRIISSQALNFYESQELCRSKYNSKLLSIKTDKESEFVHNLIKFRDVKLPVWLGAVQNDFSSFNWIDKSDVTFTNWAEGEPNDPDHACISMVASGGKWSDNDCKEQKLILCQKVVPEEGACETGWLQFRQDKCYRFVHIRLAFDDAEGLCNNLYGGHLPSIHSQEEQFMIAQFLASVNVKNGSEIWLGGRQMDFHNFNWGDGSPFNYSYWEQGEPSFPAEKCIEMSWRNGRWNDINCRLKRAVLCERQVTSRHHLKPILYQPTTCLDANCTATAPTGAATASGSTSNVLATAVPAGASSAANSPASGDSQSVAVMAVGSPGDQLQVVTAPNGTAATLNLTLTLATASGAEGALAPDDKPIKVIASIMNRDHGQSPLEPGLAGGLGSSSNNNGSKSAGLTSKSASSPMPGDLGAEPANAVNSSGTAFIHYNLPPPERMFEKFAATTTTAAEVQPPTVAAADSQGHTSGVAPPSPFAADSQPIPHAAAQEPTVSLLDKIKSAQTGTVPVVAATTPPPTSATSAATTIASALPLGSTNPADSNTTALNAPVSVYQQAQHRSVAPEQPAEQLSSIQAAVVSQHQQAATTQEFVQVTSAGQLREKINHVSNEQDSALAVKSQTAS